MECRRGDIVLVDLGSAKGEEIPKVRPAVVVSRDEQNVELDVVIVVPLSSKVMPDMEPYRVHIPKRGRLQKSSDALPYHIRAISKKRVIEKLGALDEKEMERLKTAICEVI